MTVFLGCGFAAKYPQGGGNFSVPLQWALGLKRLKCDFVWLELLPESGYHPEDERRIRYFQRQLRIHGLSGRYCLLYQNRVADQHELGAIRCIGMSRAQLRERLRRPNVLLNLSYSIHPPLLLEFERRVLCDLDPSEMFYWMTKLEMGQSHHHEFWTIGLNAGADDSKLPRAVGVRLQRAPGEESGAKQARPTGPRLHRGAQWRTFFPLVDTQLVTSRPKPRAIKFTTIGQWYWGGAVEVNGEFPDLSKKHAFEKYLALPQRIPGADFELAMNLNADDPEIRRLSDHGWRFVPPHRVAGTPSTYRSYITSATAEFTAIKGVDVAWRTGWVSDRAAAFLASGRPVITEDTGAAKYLPPNNAFRFVNSLDSAEVAVREVCRDWKKLSKIARENALDLFDSAKNLGKILQ